MESIEHKITKGRLKASEEVVNDLRSQLKEKDEIIKQIDIEHERTYQVFDYSDSYCQGLEFCKKLLTSKTK